MQVTAGSEVLYTSKAALQQGCCTWDKEVMMRDVATSGQLTLEVWAVDTSEWTGSSKRGAEEGSIRVSLGHLHVSLDLFP